MLAVRGRIIELKINLHHDLVYLISVFVVVGSLGGGGSSPTLLSDSRSPLLAFSVLWHCLNCS